MSHDIDHAVQRRKLRVLDADLLALLREKMTVPGNSAVDVSPAKLAILEPQVESQLKPVLRAYDFALFDLNRAFTTVREVAEALTIGIL